MILKYLSVTIFVFILLNYFFNNDILLKKYCNGLINYRNDIYIPIKWKNDIINGEKNTEKDKIMLILYNHYNYIGENHTNKEQLEKINDIKEQLNYKELDIRILFDYLNENKYFIEKSDGYIKHLSDFGTEKEVYLYKDRIFYLYKNVEDYLYYIKIDKLLRGEQIIPKILYKDSKSLVVEVEYLGNKFLDKNSIVINFKDQINNIVRLLKKNNICHGDVHTHNIIVNNGRLYLIDFGGCFFPGIRPKDIPEAHTNNIEEYLNENRDIIYGIIQ